MKTIGLLLAVFLLFAAGVSAQETTSSTTAASTTKTEKQKPRTHVFRPTKTQIKSGQQALIDAKLLAGEATGKYTDETREAIRSYQKANGLEVNGKFDRATLEKMNIPLTDSQLGKAPTKKPESEKGEKAANDGPKRPAPFRATSDQIKAAQQLLQGQKLYTGEIDGKFNDAFRAALGEYQKANGLQERKTLNAETLEKMGIALTDAQKANVEAHKAYNESKKD
ncbi:MAG: putative peptidoglycan binding domain protein [Acidobacteria bacterium OLB17]|nr:MAG: putative peptidoglycan binding domain protein [Acidobacteria bacterium OLB17]MCZ2391115.1 peptidoglycan-binding protein [Acidobacteriota bacterium]